MHLVVFLVYRGYELFTTLSIALRVTISLLLILGIFYFTYKIIKSKVNQRKLAKAKYNAINLSNIDNMPGQEFENYIAILLKNRGYSIEVTKGSGDLGVDILAQSGMMKYAVQTKRYNKKVSRTAVSDAVAGMKIWNCNGAMVITNNYFQKGAIELAKANNCKLIDRNVLTEWIYENQKNKNSLWV